MLKRNEINNMKMCALLLAIIGFLMMANAAYAWTPITYCQIIASNTEYRLQDNITFSNSSLHGLACFRNPAGFENSTIDLNNYTIYINSTNTAAAFYVTGFYNNTIKNGTVNFGNQSVASSCIAFMSVGATNMSVENIVCNGTANAAGGGSIGLISGSVTNKNLTVVNSSFTGFGTWDLELHLPQSEVHGCGDYWVTQWAGSSVLNTTACEGVAAGCWCGNWFNTSECIGTRRVQRRICEPDECLAEMQLIDDAWCNATADLPYRHALQMTEQYCEIQSCGSMFVNPAETPQLSCKASLEISGDCSGNITSNATMQTHVIRSAGWFFGNLAGRTYSIMVCNPLDSCTAWTHNCETEYNVTHTLGYENYYPNETIAAHFEMRDTSACQSVSSWIKSYGWTEYAVAGELKYCCSRNCGGWKCITRGLVDYRIQQHPDCTLNESSKEVCSYGCESGECITTPSTEQIRSPKGNPLSWIMQEAEFTFPAFVLNFFATSISSAGGIFATMQTKRWEIGVIAAMGFLLFFLSIGWLPQIVGVLWVMSVALMFAYLITGKKAD